VVAIPAAAAPPADGADVRPPRSCPAETVGRHRRRATPRTYLALAMDVVGRVGTLVTVTALMVVAATAGAMADGMPASGGATVTVTYDRNGR
jgi:hypothetical protein